MSGWPRWGTLVVVVGAAVATSSALWGTGWGLALASGSTNRGVPTAVRNLGISAVASPSATKPLFPGGDGDVVLTITNNNGVPMTVTRVGLPTNTTYAAGYTSETLTTPKTGCSSRTSQVIWRFSTATNGNTHTLTTPLVVRAKATLSVTLTNGASMTTSAPAACESTYFSMPPMAGVVASAGEGTATASPAADGWTS